jgi:hypothetical protein
MARRGAAADDTIPVLCESHAPHTGWLSELSNVHLLHFQWAILALGKEGTSRCREADAVEAEVIVEGNGKEREEQEDKDADAGADADEETASEGSRRPTAREGGGGGGATTAATAANARGAAMGGARNELDAAVAAPVSAAV